jgi:hypothetical protein
MTARYFAVQELFLNYFHEDWQLDADSRLDVVTELLAVASKPLINSVITELRELVREPMTDDEFHEMIDRDYWLSYDPTREHVTMRAWLTDLLGELQAGRAKAAITSAPVEARGRN